MSTEMQSHQIYSNRHYLDKITLETLKHKDTDHAKCKFTPKVGVRGCVILCILIIFFQL